MNRPKREDYNKNRRIEYDAYGEMRLCGVYDYTKALEEYCDELEMKLEKAIDLAGEICMGVSKCGYCVCWDVNERKCKFREMVGAKDE